ncbi:immunity protein YezG family protein, partial [Bacillus sp. RAR_GA_16]|uniref:immunity protein YezG family protein n=1 Tax=Bacillus sp. RAR_GA_16 TaxID=2876774 RepID=UPI001CCF57BB
EFKNQKQQPWTNLTLELTSNGKFNIEYDYEDLSNEDSYKQQVIWEYENLGKMPNENRERDLTIIKKYTKASNSNDM